MAATAGDIDGTIQQVAFYANGQAIGTDTTSPYSVSWTDVGVGMKAVRFFNALTPVSSATTSTSPAVVPSVTDLICDQSNLLPPATASVAAPVVATTG